MITPEDKILIENNPVSLATVMHGNKPNLIAVAYVKVCDGDKIVITDNFMNQTLDDIRNNTNICLACWNKDFEGIKIIGKAEYYTDGEWLQYVKSLKENEGCPAKGAIIIRAEKVFRLK